MLMAALLITVPKLKKHPSILEWRANHTIKILHINKNGDCYTEQFRWLSQT